MTSSDVTVMFTGHSHLQRAMLSSALPAGKDEWNRRSARPTGKYTLNITFILAHRFLPDLVPFPLSSLCTSHIPLEEVHTNKLMLLRVLQVFPVPHAFHYVENTLPLLSFLNDSPFYIKTFLTCHLFLKTSDISLLLDGVQRPVFTLPSRDCRTYRYCIFINWCHRY